MLKIIFAFVTFAAAGWLLLQVLPVPAAWALAGVLAGIELVGGRGSSGAGLRAVLRLDATLLAWPAAALLLTYAGVHDRDARIALAAAVAAAAGVAASRHGSGADSNRLWSVVAAVAIPVYAMLHTISLPALDPLALAGSCLAAAVAVLVARSAIVWPPLQRQALLAGAAVAGAAAAICAIPLVL
ncbi:MULTISPECIES: hypothetical protein [Metallibacterium]|jgi:hypothetical protein|uniref:hypothetical protein n=1 Tax=Metallibacterium TaxID=1218803 RepID=UPI00262E9F8E|nr:MULTISPECIES: hypothetical protein [Metallibacterium]MBW8075263.1 hypothetical protein [Metallibacterium scheffleri]